MPEDHRENVSESLKEKRRSLLWSYIGVTAYWIDEETLERRSAALSCKRLRGSRNFDVLAGALIDIHSHRADSSSNFIKAFGVFGNQSRSEEAEFGWRAPSRLTGHSQHLGRRQWSWIPTSSTSNMCSSPVKLSCHNICCPGRRVKRNREQNRLIIYDCRHWQMNARSSLTKSNSAEFNMTVENLADLQTRRGRRHQDCLWNVLCDNVSFFFKMIPVITTRKLNGEINREYWL